MTSDRPLRIGLMAINHGQIGEGGGLDIYTRRLAESLAQYEPDNLYTILTANETQASGWRYRTWPANFTIQALREFEPRQPLTTRAARRWRRWRGQGAPAHYGEAYRTRQIDELNFDVLHYPDTLIVPLAVETLCVLSFFDAQHEYYPQFFTQRDLAGRRDCYGPSVRKAAHLLVPSRFTAQTLAEKYALASDNISLIPVGAEAGFQRASAQDVRRVQEKYALPERYVYYPANPWPHKNHARLMAALHLCGEHYGTVPELVLSGKLLNEPRDALDLARAAGVEAHVHDLAFVPLEDLPALYTSAVGMVFPSFFEGFGIPLLEAMACACPIAAANATAIPDCVGEAALLFDPFDPSSIANALHTLWTAPDVRQRLAAQGMERVAQYRWEDIVPRIVEVYRSVAGRRPVHHGQAGPELPAAARHA